MPEIASPNSNTNRDSTQCVRVGQNHLTRQAAVKTDGQRFCRHLVQLQITAQLFTCWSRYRCSTFDRQPTTRLARLRMGIAKEVTRACSVKGVPSMCVAQRAEEGGLDFGHDDQGQGLHRWHL